MASSSRRTASILSGGERQRLRGERVDQVGQGEIDRDAGRARRRERLDRQRDDLGRRRDAVAADQLGAELQPLARGIELVAGDRHHLARVAQPQRARRAGQAGRGDAADLRA